MKKFAIILTIILTTHALPLHIKAENHHFKEVAPIFLHSLWTNEENPVDPPPSKPADPPKPQPEPEPEPEPKPEPEPEPVEPQPPAQPDPAPPSEPTPPTNPAPSTPRPSTPVETPVEVVEEPVELEEEVEEVVEEESVTDIEEFHDVLPEWKEKFSFLSITNLYDLLRVYLEEDRVMSLEFLTKNKLEEILFFLENEELVSIDQFDSLREDISFLVENKAEDEEPESEDESVEETDEEILNETAEIPLVEVESEKKSNFSRFIDSVVGFFTSIGAFFTGLFS